MSTQTPGITLFPLQIKIDPDGIDFTHIYGGIGHILTPKELPTPIWTRLYPFVSSLFEESISSLEFTPYHEPCYRLTPQNEILFEKLSETEEIIVYVAWWMEWSHRKKVSQKNGWKCPECDRYVIPEQGHCPDNQCPSWNALFLITGEPTLHLVPKKTGTNHR